MTISTDPAQLLSREDVAALLKVSVWTISNWEQRRGFPKAIRLSGDVYRWRRGDVLHRVARMEKSPAAPRVLRGQARWHAEGRPRVRLKRRQSEEGRESEKEGRP